MGRPVPLPGAICWKRIRFRITNKLFTIGFDPEFEDHMSLVDNSRNHALLQTKLAELGRPNLQIKFIKAETRREPFAPVTRSQSRLRSPPPSLTTSNAKSAGSCPGEGEASACFVEQRRFQEGSAHPKGVWRFSKAKSWMSAPEHHPRYTLKPSNSCLA